MVSRFRGLGLLLAIAACGDSSGTGAGTGTGTGTGGGAQGGAPSTGGGGSSSNGGNIGEGAGGANPDATIFLILMENHNWVDIEGSDSAPYLNSLLTQGAYAEQAFNPPGLHPSEPNYIWLEAGDNLGIVTDSGPQANHQATTDHLVTRLEELGLTWKSYQEDIDGTTCPLTSDGLYAPKHNPMIYFDDVTDTNDPRSANCIAHVRPFAELKADLDADTIANYNFITPNLCNDMHDTCDPQNDSIRQGDDWLGVVVPALIASPAYGRGAIILITWDEGEDGSDGPIGLIALGNGVKVAHASDVHYDHSSTLKTIEEIFGVGLMRHSADPDVNDLSDLFETFPP